jgi:hypothetical protein
MPAVHAIPHAHLALFFPLTHPATAATVPAIKMAVMESVEREICLAVHARAFAVIH